jgi:hypothetical protein
MERLDNPENQAQREAKVEKMILFLTDFEGYINESLKEQIEVTVMDKDGVFQKILFDQMRKKFLDHWKDQLNVNCNLFCEGKKPIYPNSEIIIEKDD